MTHLLPFLYGLSGAAALLHESVFLRITALRVESSAGSVATVVALMMGGLGLGSWAASRFPLQGSAAFKAFLGAEILIGLWGAMSPSLGLALEPIFGFLYRRGGGSGFLYEASRSLLLTTVILPPAGLMGATFPWVLASFPGRIRVGLVYGANALGGALAVMAGTLWILPTLGTLRTALLAGSLNLLVVILGLPFLGFAKSFWVSPQSQPHPKSRTLARLPLSAPPSSIEPLLILFLTGFCGMVWEVAWTRALGLCLGPTPFAFGIILSSYILGLSVGSVAGGMLIHTRTQRAGVLVMASVFSMAATLALLRLPLLPAQVMNSEVLSYGRHLRLVGLVSLVTLTPVCAGLGACIPLWSKLAPPSRLYAANSAGSFAGALMCAFFFLPHLGIRGSIILMASLLAAAGAWTFFSGAARPILALSSFATACGVGLLLPRPDPRALAGGAYIYYDNFGPDQRWQDAKLLYFRDGPGATVAVMERGGVPYFSVNGKIDGSLEGGDLNTQGFLAELPLALHPGPQRVLVIGLGTGITAAAALRHPGVREVVCVEISPEVVEAQRFFRSATADLFLDPRFSLRIGDGRAEVLHGNSLYDVIISEPSNPWMGGPARLFTAEFFQACRKKLSPGGIASIWIQGYALKPATLAQVGRTFLAAFPDGRLWRTGYLSADFILVGGNNPGVLPDPARLAALSAYPGWVTRESGEERLDSSTFLGRCVFSSAGFRTFCGTGDVITDDLSQLEFRAARELSSGGMAETLALISETADGILPDLGSNLSADLKGSLRLILHRYRQISRAFSLEMRGHPAFLDFGMALAREEAPAGLRAPEPLRILADRAASIERRAASQKNEALRIKALQAVVALDPGRAFPRIALARALTLQDRLTEAEDLLLQGMARGLRHEALKGTLADIRLRKGDFRGAESLLREALADFPGEPLHWTNLGIVLGRQGRSEEARSCFAKALEIEPGFLPAKERLQE